MPEETAANFRHFAMYRDMPADERSLEKVARAAGYKAANGTIRTASMTFKWVARATAYDEYIDAIAQDRHIENILEIRGRLLDIARRKVNALSPDDFTPMDIVHMVHKVAPPSRRVEHEISLHRVDNAAQSLPPAAIDVLSEYVPPAIESGTKHGTTAKEPALLRQDVVEGGGK